MLIHFIKSKHPDDANTSRRLDTLMCVRDDGSATLSKFRATHDLVHYAVETQLTISDSFFRLVAAGLDIEAFNQPGAAKALNLPAGAELAEAIVGLFEMERASFTAYSAQQFNEYLQTICASGNFPSYDISQDILSRVRAQIDDLFQRWSLVQPGESLTLQFPHEPGRDHVSGCL